MLSSALPTSNQLLASISTADYHHLRQQGETVEFKSGHILCEVGERISHVYFLNNCVVALMTVIEDEDALGVGLVGREGMVGVSCALGVSHASLREMVLAPGSALRVDVASFLEA